MSNIPWDAPAAADMYVAGLDRRRAALAGNPTLRDAVIFVMSQTNLRGDGYIVRLLDGSQKWEGPEIAALADDLPE